MRLIGYVRASTDDQKLTLAAQEVKIRAMAEVKAARLLEVVVDAGESAKSVDRPGLQRVLEMVRRKQVDGVVIAKLDRISRSVRDVIDILDLFDRKDVALISLSETLDTSCAVGRMVIKILASFAEFERELIAERTSAALQEKRRQGKRAGNVPYGYRADANGMLAENPEEMAVVKQIKRLADKGKSLRAIAEALNVTGKTTRSGKKWRFQYIDNILKGIER